MNDNIRREEQGQSMVIVAMATIVLMVFVVIAVDLAYGYVHRRTDQNAADATALAGTRELARILNANDGVIPGGVSEQSLLKAMNDYAEQNGIEDTDGAPANAVNTNVVGYYLDQDGDRLGAGGGHGSEGIRIGQLSVVHPDARGVEAIVHSRAPSFFGGIVGLDGLPIQAEAAAVLEPACGVTCPAPIATYIEDFEKGKCYNIWDGPQGSGPEELEEGSGNFGWLNWSNQGGSCKDATEVTLPDDCSVGCLEYNLHWNSCLGGLVSVGDNVGGVTGVKNASLIRDELDWYIDNDEPLTVIIYDTVAGTGCGKDNTGTAYHVVAFAEFYPVGYQLSKGQASCKEDSNNCVKLDPPSEWHGEPLSCPEWEELKGNQIAGVFEKTVTDGYGGNCNDYGASAPKMIK
jgi:hypothetical protein